jgi:hypothetical protein
MVLQLQKRNSPTAAMSASIETVAILQLYIL